MAIIEAHVATPQSIYQNEGKVMVTTSNKTSTTEKMVEAIHARDYTLMVLNDKIRISLNDFSINIREVAKGVVVIFNGYVNLIPKPYDEESELITNLIADLRTKVPNGLVTLDIEHFIAELERQNNVFISLETSLNYKEVNSTKLNMKQVQLEIYTVLRKITKRINSLTIKS